MEKVSIKLSKSIVVDGDPVNELTINVKDITVDTLIKMDEQKPVRSPDNPKDVLWRPPTNAEKTKVLICEVFGLNPTEAGKISARDLDKIMEAVAPFLDSAAE